VRRGHGAIAHPCRAGLQNLHLYGKSRLYRVGRALDDEHELPRLGFERAVIEGWEGSSTMGHLASTLRHAVAGRIQEVGNGPVIEPSVRIRSKGKQQGRHGSFVNAIDARAQNLDRIAGTAPVEPVAWPHDRAEAGGA